MKNIIAFTMIVIGIIAVVFYIAVLKPQSQTNVSFVSDQSQKDVDYYFAVQDFNFHQNDKTVTMVDGAGQSIVISPSNAAVFADWAVSSSSTTDKVLNPPSGCTYLKAVVQYPFNSGTNLADATDQLLCVNVLPSSQTLDTFANLN